MFIATALLIFINWFLFDSFVSIRGRVTGQRFSIRMLFIPWFFYLAVDLLIFVGSATFLWLFPQNTDSLSSFLRYLLPFYTCLVVCFMGDEKVDAAFYDQSVTGGSISKLKTGAQSRLASTLNTYRCGTALLPLSIWFLWVLYGGGGCAF